MFSFSLSGQSSQYLAGLELDDVGWEDLLEDSPDVLLALPELDPVDEGAQQRRLLLRALVVAAQQLRQLLIGQPVISPFYLCGQRVSSLVSQKVIPFLLMTA